MRDFRFKVRRSVVFIGTGVFTFIIGVAVVLAWFGGASQFCLFNTRLKISAPVVQNSLPAEEPLKELVIPGLSASREIEKKKYGARLIINSNDNHFSSADFAGCENFAPKFNNLHIQQMYRFDVDKQPWHYMLMVSPSGTTVAWILHYIDNNGDGKFDSCVLNSSLLTDAVKPEWVKQRLAHQK